jgi:hypothetical protein
MRAVDYPYATSGPLHREDSRNFSFLSRHETERNPASGSSSFLASARQLRLRNDYCNVPMPFLKGRKASYVDEEAQPWDQLGHAVGAFLVRIADPNCVFGRDPIRVPTAFDREAARKSPLVRGRFLRRRRNFGGREVDDNAGDLDPKAIPAKGHHPEAGQEREADKSD